MKVRAYSGSVTGAFFVAALFLGVSLPFFASASSVVDIANAIKALPPSTQTTLCAADAADCATFLEDPTLTTFSSLNSTTLSAILNDPGVSYWVPTLDPSILSTLSTSETLNETLSGLTPAVLRSFTASSFSSLTTTAISSMLGTGGLSPSIIGSLGGSLLTGFDGPTITSILTGASGNLSNLPSTLFNQLGSTQLSSILTMDPNSILTPLSGSLLTSFTKSSVISDAFNSPLLTSDIIGALPGSLIGNIPDVGMIANIFDGMSQTTLNAFTGEFFSAFSPETMTSLLSVMDTDLMSQIGGELLSGFTDTDLASIINGIDLTSLGDLGTIFTGLNLETFQGLIGVEGIDGLLSPEVLAGIDTLFTGVDVSIATDVFNALGGDAITALGGETMGAIMDSMGPAAAEAVLGAVGGDVVAALGAMGISVPGLLGFGLFVPVNDKQLNKAFSKYSSAFNKYASNMDKILKSSPDSLRDIIAGSDPKGVADDECNKRDAHDLAFAYEDGPWAWAAASSTEYGLTELPLAIPGEEEYVQVNKSGSIRCLLQELIGYQKISLFAQIHALIKQYISDAQQQQLSNQLLNKINAANLSWAKEGVQVARADGFQTTESVYVQNSTQSQYARNERTAETIVAQAAAQEGADIGSLDMCNPLETASDVAINLRSDTEDPRNYFSESTSCSLSADDGGPFTSGDPNTAFENYMWNANTPEGLGAVDTLLSMVQNPQNTPIGASLAVQSEATRRLEGDRRRVERAQLGSGFQPTSECSGVAGDPYCDPAFSLDRTSTAQNEETVVSAIESGKEQIADSSILDSTSADEAEGLSTEASTQDGGVAGYNPAELAASVPPVNALIHELYDAIQIGYYDLDADQEEWASAALLNIYDIMRFDKGEPQVAFDRGSGAEASEAEDADGPTVYIEF